jgi:hypothetical protein
LECLIWYAKFLPQKVCGCALPCDEIDADTRNATNARFKRRKALKEIAENSRRIASGEKADAIRKILTRAIEESYVG